MTKKKKRQKRKGRNKHKKSSRRKKEIKTKKLKRSRSLRIPSARFFSSILKGGGGEGKKHLHSSPQEESKNAKRCV
jgi:hypothetical protein